jgi:hypothetical protein
MMKRFPKSFRFNHGTAVSALAVLFLLSAGLPSRADATVRVSVNIQTPHVSVAVHSHDRSCATQPVRPIERPCVVIDRFDRKTARSLARQFDCCQTMLLDMRRAGYAWSEIRVFLSYPPRMAHSVFAGFQRDHQRCDHASVCMWSNPRDHQKHGKGGSRDRDDD